MSTHLNSEMVLGDTYRLVELIGRGGMGEVWRAEHTRLPRQFAVKVLHGAAAANENALARFRREAEIASRLGHPNIVQVLDFNTLDDGTPYMIMELLEGQSLRDRARHGPIPLAEVVRILRQVASALRAAHRQGVVHRDLKPDNIFLCQEELDGRSYERAKVLDFGISKIQGSQTVVTRDAEVLGTPIYMAPEQAAGRHTQVDGRTDEFALAAIAYELLSGRIAFGGETLVEVVHKIMHGTPIPLDEAVPALPAHVVTAINRALSKERDRRFPEITEFVNALAGDPALMGTTTPDDDIPTEPRRPDSGPKDAAFAATAMSQQGLPAGPVVGTTLPGQSVARDGSVSGAGIETGPPPPPHRSRRVGAAIGIALGASALVATGALLATRIGTETSTEQSPRDDASGITTRPPPHAMDQTGTSTGLDATLEVGTTAAGATAAGATAADVTAHATDGGVPGSTAADAGPEDAAKSPSAATSKVSPTDRKNARPRSGPVPLPPAVAADLEKAEQAIRRGDPGEALHLARRSLVKQRSQRAFAVMVRAYCIRRDLRMSKAMLRQLRGAARRQAASWCRRHDFDIGH